MLNMLLAKWVGQPTIQSFIIIGVTLFLVMSGKSSWVYSRTQGFIPFVFLTARFYPLCCWWANVLRLLHQLPVSSDGGCIDHGHGHSRSHLNAFVDVISNWHCIELRVCCGLKTIGFRYLFELGIVITILLRIPISEWWPLNSTILAELLKSLKSFVVSRTTGFIRA
jgi:hypothetical protein